MTQGTLTLSPALREKAELLDRFSTFCQSACQTMLSCLSDALQRESSGRLESLNRDGKPSDTGLILISEPTKKKLADCADNTHTDGGTLTLVFSDAWGTMIEDPESKAWGFIEPKPGCAVVNVADSLQALSGGSLHSCRHRVTQPSDGYQQRLFVAYFLRPELSS